MMNSIAIKPDVAPKDVIFSFDISNCEAQVPAGTVDNSVEPIYKEMPKWQETEKDARARYLDVIKALADKYLSENLLLVTHGEGVSSSVRGFVKDVDMICEVEYCAYSHLHTTILAGENNSFTAGGFVGSPEGQVGITYHEVFYLYLLCWFCLFENLASAYLKYRLNIFAKPGNILQLIGIVVTNDGNVILRELDVAHPSAKALC